MDAARVAAGEVLAVAGRLEVLVASVLLAAMIVVVFSDVVLRYVFGSPITGAGELASAMFVWVTFLGAAVAAREHMHVAVTWIVDRLPPGPARVTRIVSNAAVVLILLVVAWFGIELMNGSGARTLPLVNVPLWMVYAAVPVGCVLTATAYGADVVRWAWWPDEQALERPDYSAEELP